MQICYSGFAPTAQTIVTKGKCLPTHGGKSTERLINMCLESCVSHQSVYFCSQTRLFLEQRDSQLGVEIHGTIAEDKFVLCRNVQ